MNPGNKVLETILVHSECPDIFSWRLVNKYWNSCCSSYLQKYKISKIHLKTDLQVEEFLDTAHDPQLTVFTAFSLDQMTVENDSIPFKFFAKFGPIITTVDFKPGVNLWIGNFCELLFLLPNLENLSMGITSFRGMRIFSNLDAINNNPEISDFLSSSANGNKKLLLDRLRVINLYGLGGGGGESPYNDFLLDFCSVATNVEVIQADPGGNPTLISKDFKEKLILGCLTLRKLQRFDFCISVSESTLKKLACCRLPLKQLVLTIKEDSVRSEVLLKLLKSVTNTLKVCHLTFELGGSGRKQCFEIPNTLKNLEALTLNNFYGGSQGFKFLPKCTLLKYMDILTVAGYESMLPPGMKPLENLKEARLCSIAYSSSIAFQVVLGFFPNITKLVMEQVQDFTLTAIFRELPQIRWLTLQGDFGDEGITGIDNDQCEEITKFGLTFAVNAECLRHSLFLGDLKDLEHLHLDSDHLSDVSIILGAAACTKLIHLTIHACLLTDVSLVTVLTGLKKLKHLDFSECPLLSSDLKKGVQSEFKGQISMKFNQTRFHVPEKQRERSSRSRTKRVRFPKNCSLVRVALGSDLSFPETDLATLTKTISNIANKPTKQLSRSNSRSPNNNNCIRRQARKLLGQNMEFKKLEEDDDLLGTKIKTNAWHSPSPIRSLLQQHYFVCNKPDLLQNMGKCPPASILAKPPTKVKKKAKSAH